MVKAIAAISFVYDCSAGITLLVFRDVLPQWFGIALPEPAVFLDLNGLFLMAVGAGYALPYRDPARYRSYLWTFGVALKSAGALLFLFDYFWRAAPRSILLFASGDAVMATLTWMALTRTIGTASPGGAIASPEPAVDTTNRAGYRPR